MRCVRLAFFIGLFLLASCSTNSHDGYSDARGLPDLAALPSSPARIASAVQELTGDQFVLSGGSIDNSSGLPRLTPAAGETSFCVYEFASNSESKATAVALSMQTSGDDEAWLAISNFAANRWELLEPLSTTGAIKLTAPSGVYSNGTQTFVAVLAHGSSSFEIQSVRLNLENPGWAHLFGDSHDANLIRSVPDGRGGMWAAGYEFMYGDMLLMHIAGDGSVDFATTVWGSKQMSPLAITVDGEGNVLVAGQTILTGGDLYFCFAIKLNPQGEVVWAKEYQMLLPVSCWINEVTFGSEGQIYFVGGADPVTENLRFIGALDADGNIVWTRTWTAGIYGNPHLLLSGGRLYVSDNFSATDPPVSDGTLYCFDTGGNQLWGRRWVCDATSAGGDIGYSGFCKIALDNRGRIVWCGSSNTGIDWHLSMLSFLPDGTLSATSGFKRPDDGSTYLAGGLETDSRGWAYVLSCDWFGNNASLITFNANSSLYSAQSLSGPDSYSLFDVDLYTDGDMFLCGMGSNLNGAVWTSAPGESWTPQVTAVDDFVPEVTDSTANWSFFDTDPELIEPTYELDREAIDGDALYIRKLL